VLPGKFSLQSLEPIRQDEGITITNAYDTAFNTRSFSMSDNKTREIHECYFCDKPAAQRVTLSLHLYWEWLATGEMDSDTERDNLATWYTCDDHEGCLPRTAEIHKQILAAVADYCCGCME